MIRLLWPLVAVLSAFSLVTMFSSFSKSEWWIGWCCGDRILFSLVTVSLCGAAGLGTYLITKE